MLSLVSHYLRKYVPAAFLFGASVPYAVVNATWAMTSFVLPVRIYSFIDDAMWSFYQRFVLFAFEHVSGIKIYFYGDIQEVVGKKENVLYMSNHQSAVDWVIADMLAVRQGSLGNIRYILKEELKWAPLYGWAFYNHGCVYVRRGSFRPDLTASALGYLAKNTMPLWLVIFPEGTRYYPNSKTVTSSQEFAQKQGYAPLQNVLFPRKRGTELALNSLQSRFDAVYDVTVIYSETKSDSGSRVRAPGMTDFVASPPGAELHVLIKRLPISDVPCGDVKDLEVFLYDRFLLKDRHLEEYYKAGKIFEESRPKWHCPLPYSATLPQSLVLTASVISAFVSASYRSMYWKVALFGTFGGFLFVRLREIG